MAFPTQNGEVTRQEEFDRTAIPHTRSLLRVARRLSSDLGAAEDLVQESLLLAWRSFHQYQRGTNIRAWLFRIMFNQFHAQARKPEASAILVPLSEAISSQDRPCLDRETLRRALAELAVEHRTVLLLGVVEGFTCQEIAGILSVPIGTVMSRMSRARHALRSRLATEECSERKVL